MTFHIITLFPESFDSYVNSSIIGRALRNAKIKVKFYNPREFTADKWRRIDHRPYGGGPGMVLEAEAVAKALEKAVRNSKLVSRNSSLPTRISILWLSPKGRQFDNMYAEKISKKYKHIIIICGRYEGIDARVKQIIKDLCKIKPEEISIGPFVTTGGELPAMIIMDSVSRRIPGVLGKEESIEENRISTSDVYTRPEILTYRDKKYRVPKILLSGHHKKIEEWKNKRKSK